MIITRIISFSPYVGLSLAGGSSVARLMLHHISSQRLLRAATGPLEDHQSQPTLHPDTNTETTHQPPRSDQTSARTDLRWARSKDDKTTVYPRRAICLKMLTFMHSVSSLPDNIKYILIYKINQYGQHSLIRCYWRQGSASIAC